MILYNLDLPKRHSHCSRGAHPFEQGEACYTVVYREEGCWQRRDLCQKCWTEETNDKKANTHAVSTWQTKIPHKESISAPKHKEERALFFLKNLLSDNTRAAESYILALYLVRKKMLYLRQVVDQLGETFYLYETLMEELLPVKKALLSPVETASLQKKLAHLLSDST